MHTWHWHTWQSLPYLTCSLLDSFSHGFFTQQFAPRAPEDLTPVLEPLAQTYRVKQVHGNTVLTPTEIEESLQQGDIGEAPLPPADGVVTEDTRQAAWVCSADCVPALIADTRTRQVAAVHAGWRGTARQIVPQAIARLLDQGSQIRDLRVALGPAIAGEVYQVTTQVAAEVGATVVPVVAGQMASTEPEAVLEALWQLSKSPLHPDPHPGRVRLDVRGVNLLQLERLGLSSEQVAIAPYCTYQTPEHFFSYRRAPLKKVQWSGIVSGIKGTDSDRNAC